MLRLATIFSLSITVLGLMFNLRDMLRGNTLNERVINFITLLSSTPMLYVFIKVLQML